MPNWCDNSVTITHSDKSKIDAIEAGLSKEQYEFFQTIRPRPATEEDNWYEWNIANWGTKWDASIIDWERTGEKEIYVSFDTAWSPPVSLYEFMLDQGYDVEAMYWESGMAFCGRFADGYDDFYEYDISDRESLEQLPDELLDFTDLIGRHEDWLAEEEAEREREEHEAMCTEWFSVETNPHYVGFYETKEEGQWPFYKMAHWNGKKWTIDGKKPKDPIAFWRGLNEDPAILTEDNAGDMLENMMKDFGFEKV